MRPIDRESAGQEDSRPFERWLLDSAQADDLPQDVPGAWARFGASLASVGDVAAARAAASGGRVGARVLGGSPAAVRGARLVAAKWLVVGAFFGSALTLGLGRALRPRAGDVASAAKVVVGSVNVAPTVASPSTQSTHEAASASPPMDREAPTTPRRAAPRAQREARRNVSTLAAQVALLDAARGALAAGAFAEALRSTDRYERQFPAGDLLPEAEVVAIEALAARGDRAACRARAARFLARFPTDPHAGRVKALARQ